MAKKEISMLQDENYVKNKRDAIQGNAEDYIDCDGDSKWKSFTMLRAMAKEQYGLEKENSGKNREGSKKEPSLWRY